MYRNKVLGRLLSRAGHGCAAHSASAESLNKSTFVPQIKENTVIGRNNHFYFVSISITILNRRLWEINLSNDNTTLSQDLTSRTSVPSGFDYMRLPLMKNLSETKIKAYVHLAYGFDAQKWQQAWKAGKKIGLNEEFPYGYHHAEAFGAQVIYSKDHAENGLQKYLRYALRVLTGFDLVHAWRNRQQIFAADIVWTHTESQSLAVLSVMRLLKAAQKPKIIAQSVWLYDEWPRLNIVKKAFYRKLLRRPIFSRFSRQ